MTYCPLLNKSAPESVACIGDPGRSQFSACIVKTQFLKSFEQVRSERKSFLGPSFVNAATFVLFQKASIGNDLSIDRRRCLANGPNPRPSIFSISTSIFFPAQSLPQRLQPKIRIKVAIPEQAPVTTKRQLQSHYAALIRAILPWAGLMWCLVQCPAALTYLVYTCAGLSLGTCLVVYHCQAVLSEWKQHAHPAPSIWQPLRRFSRYQRRKATEVGTSLSSMSGCGTMAGVCHAMSLWQKHSRGVRNEREIIDEGQRRR
jgi:hypothetical protein